MGKYLSEISIVIDSQNLAKSHFLVNQLINTNNNKPTLKGLISQNKKEYFEDYYLVKQMVIVYFSSQINKTITNTQDNLINIISENRIPTEFTLTQILASIN